MKLYYGYESIPYFLSKSVLTPLLLAFLPSLSETGAQPLHSSGEGGVWVCETFLWIVPQSEQPPGDRQSNLVLFSARAHAVLASL